MTSESETCKSELARKHLLPTDWDTSVEEWTGSFYFIQAADTQYGMIDNYLLKLPNPKWDKEIRLSELLVERLNAIEPKPKFMVICGDLLDAYPGQERRRAQLRDFKRVFGKLTKEIPMVCVCGNHDIGNEPTQAGLDEYRQDFGDDYFYFVTNGVLFIVINSQFYEHRANLQDYAKEQDIWLEQILAKCKDYKYSILFQHIPWFLNNPDEEREYFNIDKEVRLTWLRKFKAAGLSKIMCGHYHRNAGGWFEDLELVVTSAVGAQVGSDRSGIRIVHMLDDQIKHQYYALEDIPKHVEL